MRMHLLLFGLLTVAIPAFAQSPTGKTQNSTAKTQDSMGTVTGGSLGNYNLSGTYGGTNTGINVLGSTNSMNLGGSSLGNGNVGTAYGTGNRNAGSGISIDTSGFSDGMSSLPAAGGSPTKPVPTTQGY